MYRKPGQNLISPENFEFPFSGKLSSDNRWVVLASLIPWAEFEDEYSEEFSLLDGSASKAISDGIRGISRKFN